LGLNETRFRRECTFGLTADSALWGDTKKRAVWQMVQVTPTLRRPEALGVKNNKKLGKIVRRIQPGGGQIRQAAATGGNGLGPWSKKIYCPVLNGEQVNREAEPN